MPETDDTKSQTASVRRVQQGFVGAASPHRGGLDLAQVWGRQPRTKKVLIACAVVLGLAFTGALPTIVALTPWAAIGAAAYVWGTRRERRRMLQETQLRLDLARNGGRPLLRDDVMPALDASALAEAEAATPETPAAVEAATEAGDGAALAQPALGDKHAKSSRFRNFAKTPATFLGKAVEMARTRLARRAVQEGAPADDIAQPSRPISGRNLTPGELHRVRSEIASTRFWRIQSEQAGHYREAIAAIGDSKTLKEARAVAAAALSFRESESVRCRENLEYRKSLQQIADPARHISRLPKAKEFAAETLEIYAPELTVSATAAAPTLKTDIAIAVRAAERGSKLAERLAANVKSRLRVAAPEVSA